MQQLACDFYCKTVNVEILSKKIAEFGVLKAAFVENELAGFIGYYSNDYIAKKAYITEIVVASNYRSQGVGKALLIECLEDCRNKGMRYCSLEVNKNNINAIRFYNHFGFSKEKEASDSSDYYICDIC